MQELSSSSSRLRREAQLQELPAAERSLVLVLLLNALVQPSSADLDAADPGLSSPEEEEEEAETAEEEDATAAADREAEAVERFGTGSFSSSSGAAKPAAPSSSSCLASQPFAKDGFRRAAGTGATAAALCLGICICC